MYKPRSSRQALVSWQGRVAPLLLLTCTPQNTAAVLTSSEYLAYRSMNRIEFIRKLLQSFALIEFSQLHFRFYECSIYFCSRMSATYHCPTKHCPTSLLQELMSFPSGAARRVFTVTRWDQGRRCQERRRLG